VEAEGFGSWPAEVLDECFGGIGLLLDQVSHLSVGGDVSVHYEGTVMVGTVRNVVDRGDGKFRVGIEWKADDHRGSGDGPGNAQMEGRLFMLFRMWEAGKRDELLATVRTIQQEAAGLGLQQLAG
jgi:hypothetical protein